MELKSMVKAPFLKFTKKVYHKLERCNTKIFWIYSQKFPFYGKIKQYGPVI